MRPAGVECGAVTMCAAWSRASHTARFSRHGPRALITTTSTQQRRATHDTRKPPRKAQHEHVPGAANPNERNGVAVWSTFNRSRMRLAWGVAKLALAASTTPRPCLRVQTHHVASSSPGMKRFDSRCQCCHPTRPCGVPLSHRHWRRDRSELASGADAEELGWRPDHGGRLRHAACEDCE